MRNNRSYYSDYDPKVYVNRYIYNNTSEAYEYYPEDYESNQSRRRKPKKQAKALEKVKEDLPVGTFKIITGFALLAVMCLGVLYVKAGNELRSREIAHMQSNLDALKEDNICLKNRIDESVDLKRIEELAKTRLGMDKPRAYQIKYIDVVKESYTVRIAEDKEPECGVFESVVKFIREIW